MELIFLLDRIPDIVNDVVALKLCRTIDVVFNLCIARKKLQTGHPSTVAIRKRAVDFNLP